MNVTNNKKAMVIELVKTAPWLYTLCIFASLRYYLTRIPGLAPSCGSRM